MDQKSCVYFDFFCFVFKWVLFHALPGSVPKVALFLEPNRKNARKNLSLFYRMLVQLLPCH